MSNFLHISYLWKNENRHQIITRYPPEIEEKDIGQRPAWKSVLEGKCRCATEPAPSKKTN